MAVAVIGVSHDALVGTNDREAGVVVEIDRPLGTVEQAGNFNGLVIALFGRSE